MRSFRMRTFAAVTLALVAVPAHAQTISREGAMRTASLEFALATICSRYFTIDTRTAEAFAGAATSLALRLSPKETGMDALMQEYQRRLDEVESAEPYAWCQQQRDVQNRLGTGIFKD